MPNQQQYNTTLQNVRQIDCKIAVLNKLYDLIDEISGRTTNVNISISADSDVRRTADIEMILKDDIYQSQDSAFYWTAGNTYWFDKYIQIYTSIKDIRTDEDVWVNQGIYCINSPSINYDAVSNSLSFQAVDLMSKMTGMRNGQLQGMTTTIPVDSNIKNAIETILLEQGFTNYILYDPPQATTPEDINIDAGGTAWDLLTQLRDINSNWEMFFDVDGVFHFQEIPSGKVKTSESTYGEPTPLVDDTIWDKVLISASYDTNFEDVKNFVEVYGKLHEVSEMGDASSTPPNEEYVNVVLNYNKNSYLNSTRIIGFTLGSGTQPEIISKPIKKIYVFSKDDTTTAWFEITITDSPIIINNETYCFKMIVGATTSSQSGEYLGYLQPKAWAIENNPDSPFYVGQFNQYTCSLESSVDFADIRTSVITSVDTTVINGVSDTIRVNVKPWISSDDYDNASNGTEWAFKIHVEPYPSVPITKMNIYVGGYTLANVSTIGINGQTISLDYTSDYLLRVIKGTTNPIMTVEYYPIEASNLSMSSTNELNIPQFNGQVRYVCAGGEYDNIYSNDLAEQRARYEVYLRARLHDSISMTCVPIYWLDVNQIISYKLPNSTSIDNDYWLVKSVNTNVSVDGTQTINATRYYPLYAQI